MDAGTAEVARLGVEVVGGSMLAVLSYLVKALIGNIQRSISAQEKRHDQNEKAMQQHARDSEQRAIDLERDLAAHKLHVSENYSTKNDLQRSIDAMNEINRDIFNKLSKIDDKLNTKVDKTGL